MKAHQKELTNWAIEKIKKEYKDDVALLIAVPGNAQDDDCHGECFDYFVPATEKGLNLARTFIIDGIGHDLYPRSWKRIENMAELKDEFTDGLAKGIILYARSDEDAKRFAAFQQKLRTNLSDREFMFKKALEKLDSAMDIYRTMQFEEPFYKVKMGAGFVARYLALAVAYLNGTYVDTHLEVDALKALKEAPEQFAAQYERIIRENSAQELKKVCYEMIGAARKFIESRKPIGVEEEKTPDYNGLAGWYEELSLSWRRIYTFCGTKEYDKAFPYAMYLQSELNIIQQEFGLKEMDLLGSFNAADLSKLHQRAQELENYIVSEIESHGVSINRYDSLEQFLEKNK
ncbi:MAG: hypothetical protein ACOYI3_00645 [Christensenellales bacterium]|jgi:hypothetical protein